MTRLSYADQNKPGLTRKKLSHGWTYFDPDGKRVTDRDEIDRLNAIALPPERREALLLVGAGGFSYEEAAAICECAVGTMKSRVARGRAALVQLLEGDKPLPAEAASLELSTTRAVEHTAP